MNFRQTRTKIVTVTLSDRSEVYDVLVKADDGAVFKFHACDYRAALNLSAMLENGDIIGAVLHSVTPALYAAVKPI